MSETETMYAIRREDGEPIHGEWSFAIVDGPTDWSLADEDAANGDGVVEYELVEMAVRVVARRTLPLCDECEKPGEFWGLCEDHAREDDPETVEEMLAARHAGVRLTIDQENDT